MSILNMELKKKNNIKKPQTSQATASAKMQERGENNSFSELKLHYSSSKPHRTFSHLQVDF